MCTVYAWKPEKRATFSLPALFPSNRSLTEPGARLAAVIPRDPLVSVPHSAGVTGAFVSMCDIYMVLGYKLRSSLLCSKHSYLICHLPSYHTWFNYWNSIARIWRWLNFCLADNRSSVKSVCEVWVDKYLYMTICRGTFFNDIAQLENLQRLSAASTVEIKATHMIAAIFKAWRNVVCVCKDVYVQEDTAY